MLLLFDCHTIRNSCHYVTGNIFMSQNYITGHTTDADVTFFDGPEMLLSHDFAVIQWIMSVIKIVGLNM